MAQLPIGYQPAPSPDLLGITVFLPVHVRQFIILPSPPPPPSQSISSPPQIVKAPPRHQAGVSCWGAEQKSVYVGCGEGVTLPTYQFLCWMRGDAIETSNTETQWLPRCPLKCRAAFHPTYTLLRRWARGRPPSDLSVLVPDARRLHHSTYQFLRWM